MVTTRAQWIKTISAESGGSGEGSPAQAQSTNEVQQSSRSRGGRKVRAPKRFVEEEDDAGRQDEVVPVQPSGASTSRGGRKKRAPKRLVEEEDETEAQNEVVPVQPRGRSRGGRKVRAPKKKRVAVVVEEEETETQNEIVPVQQSSSSRGRKKVRAPKKRVAVVVEEEEDIGMQDEIVPDEPSTNSNNARKRQDVSPDVTEGVPKMAARRRDEPASSSSQVRKELTLTQADPCATVDDDKNKCLSAYGSAGEFFSKSVEGWKYWGRPVRANLSNTAEQILYKNLLWRGIKALCRKMIDLQVEHVSGDPNDSTHRLKFKVSSYASRLNRAGVAVRHFASIHVTAQQNAETNFVFTLDNPELAEEYEVTVETLRQACERVFQTVVLRCENKDGYNKYEDPEYLESLLADANALEMAEA